MLKYNSFIKIIFVNLEHLNNLSKKNHIIIRQLMSGQRVARSIKIKYLANSQRITTATSQLNLGIITIKDFLLQCMHSTETYLAQEMRWNLIEIHGMIQLIYLNCICLKRFKDFYKILYRGK